MLVCMPRNLQAMHKTCGIAMSIKYMNSNLSDPGLFHSQFEHLFTCDSSTHSLAKRHCQPSCSAGDYSWLVPSFASSELAWRSVEVCWVPLQDCHLQILPTPPKTHWQLLEASGAMQQVYQCIWKVKSCLPGEVLSLAPFPEHVSIRCRDL